MRVIIPLLITALWASVAIDIEGVWPPVQPVREAQEALAHLEAPVTSLLAQIQNRAGLEVDSKPQDFEPLEHQLDLHHRIKEIRIALPNLPRPPARPVCG